MAFIMLLCGGSTGSDALDYIDSEHYWKSKKIEYTVEAMMLEAKKPDVAEDAAMKEAQIRRLLAIRALGEKKAQKALPLLQGFIDSKEPFVADYAKEAIARINGNALPQLDHKDQWKKAVAATPKDASGLVHMKLGRPKEFKTLAKFKETMSSMYMDGEIDEDDEDAEELKKELEEELEEMKNEMDQALINHIYPILEQVGNIRAESVTLSFADKFGAHEGWISLVVKGKYDHQALSNFLNQTMAEEFEIDVVAGVPFFTIDENASMGFVSKDTFVCTFGPEIQNQPREALINGLKNEKPIFNAELLALLKKTDKTGPTWGCLMLLPDFKEGIPALAPFDNLRIETKLVKGLTNIKITGEGKDEKEVKKAMTDMEKDYAAFLKEQFAEIEKEVPESMRSMLNLMKSLEFKAVEKVGIVEAKMPETDVATLLASYFGYAYMGAGVGGVEFGEFEEVPPAPKPAQPNPAPAQPKAVPAPAPELK